MKFFKAPVGGLLGYLILVADFVVSVYFIGINIFIGPLHLNMWVGFLLGFLVSVILVLCMTDRWGGAIIRMFYGIAFGNVIYDLFYVMFDLGKFKESNNAGIVFVMIASFIIGICIQILTKQSKEENR